MAILTPDEIGVLIYWVGEFGPQSALQIATGTDSHGHVYHVIPKPGSPQRTQIENWLDTAIAICLAESGGDTLAKNSSGASGLWQIMMPLHQDLVTKAITQVKSWDGQSAPGGFKPGASGAAYTVWDARVNTYTAAEVYRAAGFKWTPWESYTTGAYKQHLGHGKEVYAFLTNPAHIAAMQKRLQNIVNTDNAQAIGILGPHSALGGIFGASWLQPIFTFLKEGILAIGIFLLGLILVILAIWSIMKKTGADKPIKKAVKLAAVA